MEYRELLIGTWALTHTYDYNADNWIAFEYTESCIYTFNEHSFVVQGHGYHEENQEIPFFLHPDRNVLQTPVNIAFINRLKENVLELEEALWLEPHHVERIRLLFKKIK